jgi:hypothetical protein
MRRQTDAFVNRYGKRAHSEDKKPYLEDLDYPEMEMFHFDWDGPEWPPWDTPTEPDDPVLQPDDPWEIAPYWPPKAPPGPFLGCFFNPPRFSPYIASPGQTAYTQIVVREGDSIIGFELQGPIELVSSVVEVNGCREKIRAKCHVIIRVKDDVSGYAPAEGTGMIQGVLIANLASGQSCSASILIQQCQDVTPLTWDWASSAETVGSPGSAAVYVLNGQPPFKWSVSGTGFTMASSRTTGRSNTLVADSSACGTAQITVKDACGTTVQGEVRSTNGTWVFVGAVCLSFCLGQTPDGSGTVVRGGDKCTQVYGLTSLGTCGSSVCGGLNCGNCENALGSGKSCQQVCNEESAAPGCVECVKWIVSSECAFPCKCSGLCPSGNYLYLTCWRNNDLDSYEWRCAA